MTELQLDETLRAHTLLTRYVDLLPIWGLGIHTCELILGRSRRQHLHIDLTQVNKIIQHLVDHVPGLVQPELIDAFIKNAPAIFELFPWLRTSLFPVQAVSPRIEFIFCNKRYCPSQNAG